MVRIIKDIIGRMKKTIAIMLNHDNMAEARIKIEAKKANRWAKNNALSLSLGCELLNRYSYE